jgi:hypothetical protein
MESSLLQDDNEVQAMRELRGRLVVHPKTWTEGLNKVNCRRRSANAYETEFQCRVQG